MSTHSPKLLIVDDDPLAIQSLNNVVNLFGEIRFATSGEMALTCMAEDPADLILLDANMPGMDGYATCRLLKQDYPEAVVIFVTASSDPHSEIQALEAGAVDFISKPLNPPVVQARVRTHLQLKQHSDMLRDLIKRDPLTGIANRRCLDEQLSLEWRRSMRTRHALSLMMIDIDHFKAYNDFYGHLDGDNALRLVARVIESLATRAGDVVARFGGEEFSVLLTNCEADQAAKLAERMREAVQELAIPHERSQVSDRVTVSIGVATCVPPYPPLEGEGEKPPVEEPQIATRGAPRTIREFFERADQALYRAKASGRNRVEVAQY
ncbi:MAG: diguanylate cyclase [Methylococcus sp.]